MTQDLLLDAHTVLFALYEPAKLPQRVRDLFHEPNVFFVSEATLRELVNKAAALRLEMAGSDPIEIHNESKTWALSGCRSLRPQSLPPPRFP